MSRNLKYLPRLSSSAVLPAAKSPNADDVLSLPRIGVSSLEWSGDGTLLAARDETHPRCIWIWSALEAKLTALLVQLDSITCMKWMPASAHHSFPVLAYCANSPRIYYWTPSGPSWADLPFSGKPASGANVSSGASVVGTRRVGGGASVGGTTFAAKTTKSTAAVILANKNVAMEGIVINVNSLKWSSDGTKLLLIGKERFCCCEVSFNQLMGSDLDKELANLRHESSALDTTP